MNRKVILKVAMESDTAIVLKGDTSVMQGLEPLLKSCKEKNGGYVMCEFTNPKKPRSTGLGSQNSHIWGHIQQIANETGNDVDDVEDYIKIKAMKRGYPYRINNLTGNAVPLSQRYINTEEASYLIDELHILASELGITLVEE